MKKDKAEQPKQDVLEEVEANMKVDEEKIKKLEAAIKAKAEELDKKKYLIVGKETIANTIKDFIQKHASFKSTECLGIIELNKIVNEYLTGKPGVEFMIDGNVLAALNYFANTTQMTTLENAEMLFSILQSMNQALESAKEDKDQYNELQELLRCAYQGIDTDDDKEEAKDEKKK